MNGRTILVAEDEPGFARLVADALAPRGTVLVTNVEVTQFSTLRVLMRLRPALTMLAFVLCATALGCATHVPETGDATCDPPFLRGAVRPCSFDECPLCVTTAEGSFPDGVCAMYDGEFAPYDIGTACPEGFLGGLLSGVSGLCIDASACLELARRGRPDACVYADGSAFRTGIVPCAACPGLAEIACGPGCSVCPSGQICFGVSEASGLGVCIEYLPDAPGHFDGCGVLDDLVEECGPGQRCLRFATSRAPQLEGDPFGVCMSPARCEALAAGAPGRFRCDP